MRDRLARSPIIEETIDAINFTFLAGKWTGVGLALVSSWAEVPRLLDRTTVRVLVCKRVLGDAKAEEEERGTQVSERH